MMKTHSKQITSMPVPIKELDRWINFAADSPALPRDFLYSPEERTLDQSASHASVWRKVLNPIGSVRCA